MTEKDELAKKMFMETPDDDHKQGPGRCDVTYCVTQENKSRGNWTFNVQSTMALVAAAMGLGNVWRFPKLVFTHGPAFLAVYFVGLVVLGGPMVYYEMSVGQFTSNGVLTCWPVPIFKGLGAAMLSYGVPLSLYYNLFGAYSVYYLHETVRSSVMGVSLPWASKETVMNISSDCSGALAWLTPHIDIKDDCSDGLVKEYGICWLDYYSDLTGGITERNPQSIYDIGLAAAFEKKYGLDYSYNDTVDVTSAVFSEKQPVKAFYECNVLLKHLALQEQTEYNLPVIVAYLIVWLLLFMSLTFGVKSIGMVVMVTVPLMISVLLALTVKGATVAGPNISMMGQFFAFSLADVAVVPCVTDAVMSVCWSLCIGLGYVITYSSYNRFHNNFVRDLVIFISSDLMINIIATYMVFCYWSYYSHHKGLSMNDIVTEGPDLVFVSLLEIFNTIPGNNVWCGLLFFVTLLLIINPMLAQLETVITAFLDQIGSATMRSLRPMWALILCVVLFLVGLPLCTSYGYYWASVIYVNMVVVPPVFVALMMILSYIVYGILTYFWHRHDVAAMATYDLCCIPSVVVWVTTTCLLFSAGLLLLLGTFSFRAMEHTSAFRREWYPVWMTDGLQDSMTLLPFIVIIVTVVIQLILGRRESSVKKLFRVSDGWTPAMDKHKKLVSRYRADNPQSSYNYYKRYRSDKHKTKLNGQEDVQMAPLVEDMEHYAV